LLQKYRLGANKQRRRSMSGNAHEIAREQNDRLEAAAIGLDAVKPFFEYQTKMLRFWAYNCELLAHNYQRSLATFSEDIKKSARRQRDAA
jgi:hypothetical protein